MLLGALGGSTAVLALVLGLVVGAEVRRSLSVGWYLTGSVVLLGGFFVGNRGPARPRAEWNPLSLRRRWVRWATPDEQNESISLSVLLIVLGGILIALAAVVDPRSRLF
jgi:hypothetical protein